VGIALGEGIAIGVGVPLVGVGSLEALAHACDAARPRIAVLDAGRGELFVAAYAADGTELVAPCALAEPAARERLLAVGSLRGAVAVGEGAARLGAGFEIVRDPGSDLPHACTVAALAATRDPVSSHADPIYVRGAGATLPNLPPSPLASEP
jgi:tRNA threonylcarbamoyladenosine biosynthesis protein TsaB